MHSRRSTHELCAVDNYIFAVGGNDGSSSLNSVEVRNYARFENNAHEFMMLSNDLTFSNFSRGWWGVLATVWEWDSVPPENPRFNISKGGGAQFF